MTRLVKRLAWTGILFLMALLVVGVQLDRQTYDAPQFASLVPAVLRGQALERIVQQQIAAGNAAAARDSARLLVTRRPLPADHLVLNAQASVLAGDDEAAIAGLEAAATRGWREPTVQLAVAEAALRSGATDVAANRVAALLALGIRSPTVDALLPRLLSRPEGRASVAAIMGNQGYWQPNFVRQAPAVVDPADFADTIRLARAGGAEPDCRTLQAAMALYRREGADSAAAALTGPDCAAIP